MNNSKTLELSVGLFVLFGIGAIFFLALKASNFAGFQVTDGYRVVGYFDNVDGLKVRAPVKASGVTVGRVDRIGYNTEEMQAEVVFLIDSHFNDFPSDTVASVFTAGLLGEKYIGLEPGGEESVLKEGSVMMITESSVVLERLISQFLYSKAAGDE